MYRMEKNIEKIIKNLTKYFIFYLINKIILLKEYTKTIIFVKYNSFINRKNTMALFRRLLFLFCLISFGASAYSGPRGLYVLEYPVDMPDVSLVSEEYLKKPIRETNADLTVMIFWSQNCAPCLREMRDIENLYPKAARDNIDFMLVSSSSEWTNSEEERLFLTKYGAPTVPFYSDPHNKLSLSLGIGSTPYTVIMDKNGKKVATLQGEANWSSAKLYKQIQKLIK